MLDLLLSYSRTLIDSCYGPTKPSDDDVEANILIEEILQIYDQMLVCKKSDSFAEINDLFSGIRLICTKPINERVTDLILYDPRIVGIVQDLRSFCSDIEFRIETQWGLKAVASENSTEKEVCERILEFPYMNVYANLIRAELSGMRSVEKNPIKRIAFIGSGPLPISSLCLTGMIFDAPTNIRVLNIDRDEEALELSKTLCSRLGKKAGNIEFQLAEAGSNLELYDYDAVYLAALVGDTQQQKEMLLEQVTSKMRPGALLVMRSGSKIKSLIYSNLDPTSEAVSRLIDIALILHPHKYNIVNSVYIGRVKGINNQLVPT
ncbi:Nicotianamine synthase 2 [Golovinomyces cichoracearum]|uniref:Nicotianamine synthase 2 n=1 Tax=Golovinomyces cichoracearum TaxID=62708 RepID=A0A420IPE7_9PEZI|nr:Nicotianamine synthase 2 [Golovinomyces cichoracearum]